MSLGISLGTMAVDCFFFMSGFLVCASLLRQQNLLSFFWARFFRIIPGLFVVVMLTVFALGPWLTTLSSADYFRHSATTEYLLHCITLVNDVAFVLPGVFDNNPFRQSVNGSLWSLPYEIGMYGILMALWAVSYALERINLKKSWPYLLAAMMTGFVGWMIADYARQGYISTFPKLGFMFFWGVCFYTFRERITLNWWGLFGCALLLWLTSFSKPLFLLSYLLVSGYVLLALAYLPSGSIRLYNNLGDYSYGIYIYAFPIQQTLVFLIPGIDPINLMIYAFFITMVLAVMSWHLVEERSMRGRYWFTPQAKVAAPVVHTQTVTPLREAS